MCETFWHDWTQSLSGRLLTSTCRALILSQAWPLSESHMQILSKVPFSPGIKRTIAGGRAWGSVIIAFSRRKITPPSSAQLRTWNLLLSHSGYNEALSAKMGLPVRGWGRQVSQGLQGLWEMNGSNPFVHPRMIKNNHSSAEKPCPHRCGRQKWVIHHYQKKKTVEKGVGEEENGIHEVQTEVPTEGNS